MPGPDEQDQCEQNTDLDPSEQNQDRELVVAHFSPKAATARFYIVDRE
jgi:hypothetical protein